MIYCGVCTGKDLADRKYDRAKIIEIGEALLSTLVGNVIDKKK
jgi:hypothetical protein